MSPGRGDSTRRSRPAELAPLLLAAAILLVAAPAGAQSPAPSPAPAASPSGNGATEVKLFFLAASKDEKEAKQALATIARGWQPGDAALILDMVRFMRAPGTAGRSRAASPGGEQDEDVEPDRPIEALGSGALGGEGLDSLRPTRPRQQSVSVRVRERLIQFLEKQTGEHFGQDLSKWHHWLWQLPYAPHPEYAVFKAALYSHIDPEMVRFFMAGTPPRIRLDEIDWGGVKVGGIPALDHPKTLPAAEASFMGPDDIVFGVSVNGEARAYPRRILAWHEICLDQLGGVELTLVDCPLCGTVIPYRSEVAGHRFTFGTSGLLYRSNKLMFDAETRSLWDTSDGRPVVGRLAASKLELPALPVVRTTWKDWTALHPDTSVLSLETGFERDYSEGAAYRDYLGSQDLMFDVPKTDDRLRNKDEILGVLLRPLGEREAPRQALAISGALLAKTPILHASLAGHDLVVVTSSGGASRVYEAAGTRFVRLASDGRHVIDDRDQPWDLTEGALLPDGRDEPAKRRLPARPAFWFGWFAQFPDTALLK